MRSKTSGCLITLLLLGLIVSLGLNFGLFLGKLNIDVDAQAGLPTARPKKKLHESVVQSAAKSSRDKIVHIDLDGIITSVKADGFLGQAMPGIDKVKRSLEQAMEDASVKAIVLRINSPGGEVTASDVLYNAVKKAAKVKPVVVYMDAMAASGGYYVSCGATKIVAAETTLTASIGVIMETLNYSELFGKVGLSMNTFTSGAFKDSLSGARPMRDDEKAYVQNLVTQMYERFLGIVSEARGVPKETLKSTVADGRVVTGREALKAKLVDQIGYVEDAYTLARELGKAPDAGVVKYRNETNFFEILAAASTATPPSKVQVEVGGGLLPQLQPGMLYYLPPGYAR